MADYNLFVLRHDKKSVFVLLLDLYFYLFIYLLLT